MEDVRSSTVHTLAELLGTVVFVEEVVGNLLQIGEVAVEESTADGKEIGVSGVLNLDHTPWVLASAHFLVIDLNEVLGTHNGEGHQRPQLGVLFYGVLIILLNIIWEVVDGNAIVLNILHDQLLGLGQFCGRERIGLADDGNDVDTWRQALHKFNVEFTETVAGGCDEIKEHVDTVVSEAGVTLNSRLLRKNIIILALEVADNLAEAV